MVGRGGTSAWLEERVRREGVMGVTRVRLERELGLGFGLARLEGGEMREGLGFRGDPLRSSKGGGCDDG